MYECTQAEQKILELLWQHVGMTKDELAYALCSQCGWSQSAVYTLLGRMQQKNVISLEESQNVERYVCRAGRGQVTTKRSPIAMSMPERLKRRFAKGGKHQ